jgi:hypothetical protein
MLQNSDNKPSLTSISAMIYSIKFFRGAYPVLNSNYCGDIKWNEIYVYNAHF